MRSRPFTFQYEHDFRPSNVPDRSPFLSFSNLKKVTSFHETSRNVHTNGQERLEMFEPGRSNVLERVVENVHCTLTSTLQKRKNYCIFIRKIQVKHNNSLLKCDYQASFKSHETLWTEKKLHGTEFKKFNHR